MTDVSFEGGEKLKKFFKNAGKGGIRSVDVGIFAGSRYPDGTPVAAVAAWNEFGTDHGWGRIPERPAIRNANRGNEDTLIRLIKNTVDPETMVITKRIGGLIGKSHQWATQQSIINLRDPANKESTKKAKKSGNPLIGKDDTYKNSITFKVVL